MPQDEHLIGVLSDTHGMVRPGLVAALAGCELILHAGDVGRPEVLEALRAVAPVMAVRGNVDQGDWATALPATQVISVGSYHLYMLHDLNRLDLDPAAGGFSAVISGHSHRPLMRRAGGVLFLNPGSAGPQRFTLPSGLAYLHVSARGLEAELINL